MYIELLKALYGTMRAARLFWERLSKQLVDWGFTPNPYDSCVVNKMVDGKQLTVAWHVDDLKILHVSTKVVDDLIADLDSEFGKETPSLSKSRGKVHDYLGMTLDFSVPGQVTVTMIDYIKMICMDLLNDMIGKAATPATNRLFQVDDENAAPPPPRQGLCGPVLSSNNAAAVSKPKGTSRYLNSNFVPMQVHTASK
jgi:hypothetical protein